MFDLNLKPTFLCCRAAVPAMKRNGYGRIVSVSSRSGLTGAGDYAAYAVAKGAIKTFTASLAEEVLGDNILVNAIAPSTIDTEANRKAMPKAKHELGEARGHLAHDRLPVLGALRRSLRVR